MRSKLSEIVLTAGVLLALVFTISCSSDIDDNSCNYSSNAKASSSGKSNGSSSSIGGNNNSSSSGKSSSSSNVSENTQIYSYECGYEGEDEDYICDFVPYTKDGSIYDWYLNKDVGTVTEGIAKLQLPLSVQEEDLEPVFLFGDDDEIAEFCSEYTKDITTYRARIGLKDADDEYLGELSIKSEDESESVEYWYFPNDGKVKCEIYDGEVIFDLTVKNGWNPIYKKITIVETNDSDYSVEKYSTQKNILTKEVKWFLN